MLQPASRQFFLGANTGAGFVSLYDELIPPEENGFLWCVKGGPGNGKSTLMRRAAERAVQAGLAVEYVLCSGDPDSLDGIYIPEKRIGYVDATSPHVQEPKIPGFTGRYLDLSRFYRPIPPETAEKLGALFAAYRAEYARAYDLLHAASLCAAGGIPGLVTADAQSRVRALAGSIADSVLTDGASDAERRRFLSACTCRGCVLLGGTAAQYGSVYTLESELGLTDMFLRAVLEAARARKTARIVCPDPLDPSRLAALILPEQRLSLVAVSGAFRYDGTIARHFHLDEAATISEEDRERILRSSALCTAATEQAVTALRRAKTLHDALEAEYRPFVDFPSLTRFEEKHLETAFPA